MIKIEVARGNSVDKPGFKDCEKQVCALRLHAISSFIQKRWSSFVNMLLGPLNWVSILQDNVQCNSIKQNHHHSLYYFNWTFAIRYTRKYCQPTHTFQVTVVLSLRCIQSSICIKAIRGQLFQLIKLSRRSYSSNADNMVDDVYAHTPPGKFEKKNKRQSKLYCEIIFDYVKFTISGRSVALSAPFLDPLVTLLLSFVATHWFLSDICSLQLKIRLHINKIL